MILTLETIHTGTDLIFDFRPQQKAPVNSSFTNNEVKRSLGDAAAPPAHSQHSVRPQEKKRNYVQMIDLFLHSFPMKITLVPSSTVKGHLLKHEPFFG